MLVSFLPYPSGIGLDEKSIPVRYIKFSENAL